MTTNKHRIETMKFNGLPLQSTTLSTFQLRRACGDPLPMRLRPLSLGFHQRLRSRGIQPPQAPIRIARDSVGKPLRDAHGLVLTLEDERQPEHVAELERYHQRVAVLAVAEAIAEDPHLCFDSSPPADNAASSWQGYADALFAEMEGAGFTAGDLVLLCREICRMSNLIEDDLAAAQANFSASGQNDST